ncbi:Hypothetical protein PHPALM_5858 [Phytophthora palmivora]|uniref:Uncharacterized protein n=1 Tax=Phytophthora palmivora TaxID=4796 RepID=A0A2P4YGC6_9STRA|nr:Hypothetical protein PHPALM_5858 [Phytophthora palmivora]
MKKKPPKKRTANIERTLRLQSMRKFQASEYCAVYSERAETACPRVPKDYQTLMGDVAEHDQHRLQRQVTLSCISKLINSLIMYSLQLSIKYEYQPSQTAIGALATITPGRTKKFNANRVFLCDKARHKHSRVFIMSFGMWHKAWPNGTQLPTKTMKRKIRARTPARRSEDASSSDNEGLPASPLEPDVARQNVRAQPLPTSKRQIVCLS